MTDQIKLKIKRINPRAELPTYAHPGEDACFDLRIIADKEETTIYPANTVIFRTGLIAEVPQGYVLKMHVRSSIGIKRNLILANGTGIIDSGYRGELHIALNNIGHEPVTVRDCERVAQAELCKVLPVRIVEVSEVSDSSRGTGGIGSSGRM